MQKLFLKSNKEHKRTSQYVGVSWHKIYGTWWARISVLGIKKDLGFFKDELEAAKAYNEVAKRYGKPLNLLEM